MQNQKSLSNGSATFCLSSSTKARKNRCNICKSKNLFDTIFNFTSTTRNYTFGMNGHYARRPFYIIFNFLPLAFCWDREPCISCERTWPFSNICESLYRRKENRTFSSAPYAFLRIKFCVSKFFFNFSHVRSMAANDE